MSDIPDSSDLVGGPPELPIRARVVLKSKPIKTLPTDRLVFDKQLSVLRAYAAASGPDKQPTSNADVGKIADLNPNTISICNPFFVDCGLLIREGAKQRPSEAVFDYQSAWGWNQETAGQKLNQLLSGTWFAKALLPKLGFRSLTIDEAVAFLAEEAKASKEYRDHLVMLLAYLRVAGIVAIDGTTVTKVSGHGDRDPAPPPPAPSPNSSYPSPGDRQIDLPQENVEKFSIPLPGKPGATIIVPKDLDADDWEMLVSMMETYIKRWKKGVIKDETDK